MAKPHSPSNAQAREPKEAGDKALNGPAKRASPIAKTGKSLLNSHS
jgi:hypothetical protein